ncbi:DUF4235 domain-containing protein [Arthrobacter agilis]|uniref:DUF4235 domain-containing protein n=1 Tax=Arthrobacter bussei TaxID=2594179 RepID=A0A7X1NNV2_9MICC|nr:MULTISPECIES: DUF4235 domain-containing protein [Arthrobacter]MPY10203.1 DUF4235 domain-containing protein [Arthrobacter bussei]OUM43106.1 hypothetical protein B8W74_07685 [Arthrobacter agilis]PPB46051.1 DUF4235 domain-containing protein [Arthrobacter agilis]TPV25593.1 DUF4235 domain-containing protein [Arthrobacter agilis]WDF32985.1 DUF4235 domain-containing protein [Arthrobacter agilis]
MNVVFKLLGVGMSVGAGFVGTKLVDFLWEKITGEAPPKSKDGLENTLRSALVFAIISGAVSTTIQVLTNRSTQKAIERFAKTRDLT